MNRFSLKSAYLPKLLHIRERVGITVSLGFRKARHYKTETEKTTKVCGGRNCEPLNRRCCQLDGRDACFSDRDELRDVRKTTATRPEVVILDEIFAFD